ncbi:MAG: PD-(D/E)XK nuclease family protein [Gammaproteobacteria bacterium]|nr:PD-(D/E)XK nuclease family protein [Gammaproteobacteria bacterium]
MTNPLAYVTTPIPEDGVFKISPSAFAKFISAPHNFYRDEVMKEDPFSHNTSSVLGTIIHYCAEKVAKEEEVDMGDIDEYIDMLEEHEEYCRSTVRMNFVAMAETLVNDYVLEQQDILEIETQHVVEVKDHFYAGGTIDLLQGSKSDCMITDYKSYNSKTKPKTIPANYKYQLLVYAWILRKLGYTVTRIRLVYINRNIDGGISDKTGKPLKSYPPEVTVLTEMIEEDDFDFIESQLELCVDSLLATKAYPELTYVIWHDPRLK